MAKKDSQFSRLKILQIYSLLLFFILLTTGTTYILYTKTQELFRWSLDERLISLASLAASKFDSSELDNIEGAESIKLDTYRQTVLGLQDIRNRTKDVEFVYILRKTDDPNTLEFVADADSLTPDVPTDLNEDGVIDDSDALNFPGDRYDVTDLLEFRQEAFNRPYVDPDLVQDQWGTFLSGHAPIVVEQNQKNESSKYIIGLDLNVTEFQNLINIALLPFAFFIVFLLIVLTGLTVILKRMWGDQVHLLAELDKQKDELLGMVSHQLATPISAIKWYVEMLLDGDLGALNAAEKEQLQTVYKTSFDLSDLVSMILDVSRIQLGRMTIEKQPLDLNEFFKDIFGIVEPRAVEKKVEFIKNMPAKLPEAMLDKRYTKMTIENLMTNAVKYTPEGGKVTVNIAIENNKLKVSVQDTGVGIPKADQKEIFGKMFRASNVRNSKIDGNGFGLFVAKGAVESQGGEISFESTEGKGTTFYVTLPLK